MKALFKTLFGDLTNLVFVASVMAVEVLFVHGGYARDAAFIIPVIILAGMGWLATR